MSEKQQDWIDASKVANDAMAIARNAMAAQRANQHVLMLMLATLASTAPGEAVDKLLAEFERIRDLSGPAGAVANDIFALAVTTLERHARRD